LAAVVVCCLGLCQVLVKLLTEYSNNKLHGLHSSVVVVIVAMLASEGSAHGYMEKT